MGFFEDIFFKLRGETKLYVRKVLNDHVELPLARVKLYGVALNSTSDVVVTADEKLIKKLYNTKSPIGTKYLFTIIIKNKVNDFFRTEVFFLSYSKSLIDTLTTELSAKVVRKLNGIEISNLLYRMLTVKTHIDFDSYDGKLMPLEKYFKNTFDIEERFKILSNETKLDQTKCFIGGNYIGTDFSQYEKTFSIPFTGILYLCLNLDDQLDFVKRKLQQSLQNRKGLADLKEKIEKKEIELGAVHVCFITNDEQLEYLVTLFGSIGFIPIEKNFGRNFFIQNTPLMIRDLDFYFQLPLEYLTYYIPISVSKNTIPEYSILYGKNRYHDYVGFNNFEENDNPHMMIFAPSGAGKSFFLQNFISQILRVNVGALYQGEISKLRDLPGNIYIRHFDKGFSAELFYKLMKHRGYDVEIVSPRIDEMAYNICEVDTEEDYEFSLGLVNALLSALEQKPLEGLERAFYARAIREAYTNPTEYISMRKQPIGKLLYSYSETMSGVFEKLKAKGYDENDLIEDIKEPEFNFLKKATLLDIIRILSQSRELTLTNTEKEALDSTITKLEILSTYDLIRRPATFDFKSVKVFYFDYEFLYTHTFFTPLFLAMIKKLVFTDKFYKKEDEYAFYFIDEAHNLFRKPIFAELLNILIREARKYRISIVFATQNFVDIPADIIQNANTKMFLTPQEYTQKKAYLRELSKHIDIDLEKEHVAKVYYEMPMRQLTTWYRDGVFGLFLDVDEYKLKVFDSYRKLLELPDGKTIKKSMLLE